MRTIRLMMPFGLASLVAACAGFPTASPSSGAVSSPSAPQSTAAAPGSTPSKASDESVAISFAPAEAALSSTAYAQLDGAARLYRDASPEVMIVSGHTDKTGSEFSNLILSARRAEAVKQALVDRGVPADRLQVVAIGEAEPVPSIPPSRSAVITWR